MAFELPKLPYAMDALAPNISAETLEFHHGKHHATYVTKLNNLIKGTKLENASLEADHQGGRPRRPVQQRGAAFQSQLLLEVAEAQGRRRAEGHGGGRDQERLRRLRGLQEEIHRGGGHPFRQRMGMAGARSDGSLEVIATHDADSPIAHKVRRRS